MMHVTFYKKYFDRTPSALDTEELSRLTHYFGLLSKVAHPVASLIVPVYRAKQHLLAHLFSLSYLKTIIPYEVIFVDNNADRETLDILAQVGAKVVKEKRQGITHARQRGLEAARGQIICTMDPDSIYDPYYIDKMVLPFFEEEDLVLCYSVSKSYIHDFGLTPKMNLRNWLKVRYFKWKLSQSFINKIKFVRAVTMSYRKEALAPIGYPIDLKAVSGCDDGMVAMHLNNLGVFKYVSVDVYTALPPPREPGKPFPFCNERFYKKSSIMEETIKALEIETLT